MPDLANSEGGNLFKKLGFFKSNVRKSWLVSKQYLLNHSSQKLTFPDTLALDSSKAVSESTLLSSGINIKYYV